MVRHLEKFYIFYFFTILFGSSLLKYNAGEIKWEKINDSEHIIKNKKIIWEKYYPEPLFEEFESDNLQNINHNNNQLDNKELKKNSFI